MAKKRNHGAGALYSIRGGKLWRGVVDGEPDEDGKRVQHYVHAATKTACQEKLDKLKEEIAKYGAPVNKTVKVDEWSTRWLETIVKPNVDPSTYRGYRSSVNQRINPVIGHRRVSALTPADIRKVIAKARDAGRAPSTLKQTHTAMNLMVDAARAEGLIRRNVVEDVPRPAVKSRPKGRGALSTKEGLAILEAALALPDATGSRHWFRLLTGPRQTEVLGARLEDLDLDASFYDLQWKLEALGYEHGCYDGDVPPEEFPCGYKRAASCPQAGFSEPIGYDKIHLEGRWHLTHPKGGSGRTLPIIPQLRAYITEYLRVSADWPNPHGLIWRNPDGSVIDPKQDQQEWRELLHAAGAISEGQAVPGGTDKTTHIGRHTTVTVLAAWGVDFQIIGEIVGHSTAEVTKIYRHARRDELMRAANLMGEEWASALEAPTTPREIGT